MDTITLIKGLSTIRDFFGVPSIALSGGEPLLRSDFAAVYRSALSLFGVTLFSSGHGLEHHAAMLASWPPQQFITSLYGLADVHNAFCGNSTAFARVIECLHFFRRTTASVAVNVICHRANRDEVPEVLRYLHSHSLVDEVKILALSPVGRGEALRGLLMENAEWVDFVDRLHRLVVADRMEFRSGPLVERHVRRADDRASQRPSGCSVCEDADGVFSSCIHIDANGDLYPCVMLLRRAEFCFGNIASLGELDLQRYYGRRGAAVSAILDSGSDSCAHRRSCTGACLGYQLSCGSDYRCAKVGFEVGCPTRYGSLV